MKHTTRPRCPRQARRRTPPHDILAAPAPACNPPSLRLRRLRRARAISFRVDVSYPRPHQQISLHPTRNHRRAVAAHFANQSHLERICDHHQRCAPRERRPMNPLCHSLRRPRIAVQVSISTHPASHLRFLDQHSPSSSKCARIWNAALKNTRTGRNGIAPTGAPLHGSHALQELGLSRTA